MIMLPEAGRTVHKKRSPRIKNWVTRRRAHAGFYCVQKGGAGMFMGISPDCDTCWKKETCPSADSGTFCPQWQAFKPEPEGEDPNERWRRGDDDWDDVHG